MTKLKSPLFSLGARNTLGQVITFCRRLKQNVAEKKPEVPDAKTLTQLSWRHMYQKAVALWHGLSVAERQDWESQARSRHMTGFAWFMSQALRPNPGLYLPLQGGTMTGEIDMGGNRIEDLPDPTMAQDPLTLAYYTANIAPYLYNEGARAYHNANQTIAHATETTLAFNSERYDTDTIHDPVVFNSRLTCKTAGKYLIAAVLQWAAAAAGTRYCYFRLNGVTNISGTYDSPISAPFGYTLSTIYDLSVTDYIEVRVYQSSGAPLNLQSVAQTSPEFMMQRVGT